MGWWGKVLGGTFGFMVGGPLGALLGAALGHRFDKGAQRFTGNATLGPGVQERVQTAFFAASFSVMGHLAKADGRVSAHEIDLARQVMTRMNLASDMRRTAIHLFNEGKAPDFSLDEVLDQFRHECHGRQHLILMFVEIQLHAAFADGELHAAEAQALHRICERLGIRQQEYRHLEAMVRAARQFAGGRAEKPPTAARKLKDAYAVLGVASDAPDAEVKKAYRRLMNRHHPDKLVAKGLPDEMISMATEKTQEIKAAYETVRSTRTGGS
jgi:DnaJ like chaperone protein